MTTTAAAAIDWDAARRRAAALVAPGPPVGLHDAHALVAALRVASRTAPEVVGEVTGLTDAAAAAAARPTYVVDRPRWAAANVETFATLLGDAVPPTGPGGARLAGEQLGVLLSLLATRVLGQYDPFTADGGRLLLVAPNVLQVQRALDVDAADFHLWVCLHEQTHALQFAAAPWLAEHLRGAMSALTGGLGEQDEAARRFRSLVTALPRVLGGEAPSATSGGALIDAVLTDEERVRLERVLAVMALLEGHADVVMDAAGPAVVPTVERIRRSFEARRDGRGLLDVLLRRLLGLDAKLAQYRQGGAFVRNVVDAVGHAGLNAVWSGPDALPRAAEIADPAAWVARVHG